MVASLRDGGSRGSASETKRLLVTGFGLKMHIRVKEGANDREAAQTTYPADPVFAPAQGATPLTYGCSGVGCKGGAPRACRNAISSSRSAAALSLALVSALATTSSS